MQTGYHLKECRTWSSQNGKNSVISKSVNEKIFSDYQDRILKFKDNELSKLEVVRYYTHQ